MFKIISVLVVGIVSLTANAACIRFEGCLDGGAFFSIKNNILTVQHRSGSFLGKNDSCKNIQTRARNQSLYSNKAGGLFLQNVGFLELNDKGEVQMPVEIKQLNRFEIIETRGTVVKDYLTANRVYMVDDSPSGRFSYGGAAYFCLDLCD